MCRGLLFLFLHLSNLLHGQSGRLRHDLTRSSQLKQVDRDLLFRILSTFLVSFCTSFFASFLSAFLTSFHESFFKSLRATFYTPLR